MNKTLIKTLFILVGVLCGVSVIAQENKQDLIIKAKMRAFEGKPDEASKLYRQAIDMDPNCDACYYELANITIAANNFTEAKKYAETAYNLDKNNSWYTLLYARLCFHFAEYDKAEGLFRNILKSHGDKQDVWLNLASIYEEQENYAQASGILDSMVMLFGDNDDIAYKRFNLYMNLGEFDKAITEVKKLVNNYPSDTRFTTLLADTYSVAGKDSLAIDAYDKVINTNEAFPPALLGKAELYRKNGKFPEYFKTLQKYMSNRSIEPEAKIEYLGLVLNIPSFANYFKSDLDTLFAVLATIHPASIDVKFSQAYYFANTGRADLAVTLLSRITDMDSSNKNAWNGLLSLEYSLQMYNQLEISSEQALNADPKYAAFYMFNGLALWHLKKINPAIKILETGIKKADYDSVFLGNAYSVLGDLYFSIKKDKKAFSYYDKALKIDPNNATVLNNYAYYLSLKNKDLNRAFKMSQKAIELESGNASFLDTYAYILYLQEKYVEAKVIYRQALAAGGNNSAVVLDHYADTLNKLGERSTAEIYWSQALEKPDCENAEEIKKKLKK